MGVEVVVSGELLSAILENAKALYPRETILLLRGKAKNGKVEITELVVPPFAAHGKRFSSFPAYMLPMDFSLVGSVHSHPSGVAKPSVEDLNRSFGRVVMIVSFPFDGKEDVVVYNRSGEKLALRVAV